MEFKKKCADKNKIFNNNFTLMISSRNLGLIWTYG